MGRISVDGTQFLPLDMERSRFCLPSGSFPSVRFFSSSVNLREHVGLCVPRHGVGVARQLLLAPIPTVPYPSQRLRMLGTRTYLELRPFFRIHSVSKPVEIGQRQGLCHSVHVEAFLLSSLSPSHRLLSLHFRPFLSLLPPHDLVFFVLFSDEARACVRACGRSATNVVLCSVCQQRFESMGRSEGPPVPNGHEKTNDRRGF